MKKKPLLFRMLKARTFGLLVLIATVLISCTKDSSSDIGSTNKYLVSYEKLSNLQKSIIISTFTTASLKYQEIIPLRDNTQYSVDVYKIEYKTTFKGEEMIASGLVAIPDEAESFPILSFQNGTNTAHANAPTEGNNNINFLLMTGMAGNGYIMLIPDYIGFGTSKSVLHPYIVKEPTYEAIIDLIYATQEYLDQYSEKAMYDETYFLAGYSQGGYSTLTALKEIESNPDIQFTVTATSCGAGVYDIMETTNYVLNQEVFPGPQYLPYYVYSHMQYGSLSGSLSDYFNEPYASSIPELFNGSYTNAEVNSGLNDTLAVLLSPNFLANYSQGTEFEELRNDMNANTVSAWKANSLLRFYHGDADKNVPPEQSSNIYVDFQNLGLGEQVAYYSLPDLTHETGVYPWGIQSVLWFNELRSVANE